MTLRLWVQVLDSPNGGAFANSFSLLNVIACCSANVSSLAPYSLYSVLRHAPRVYSIAAACGVTPAVGANAPGAARRRDCVSAPAPTLLLRRPPASSWSAPAELLTYELLRCLQGSAAGTYTVYIMYCICICI